MNRNLNEAIFDIAKVEAIMFAFENTYLELDVAPADRGCLLCPLGRHQEGVG